MKFPKFNRFCFCMDLENGVKITTIIILVIEALLILSVTFSISGITLSLLQLIDFISILFFAIGIKKLNKSYLLQFIYVQLGYIIIYTIEMIVLIAAIFLIVKRKNGPKDTSFESFKYNNYSRVQNSFLILLFIYGLSIYLFRVYYYICAGSYANTLIEKINEVNNTRDLESCNNSEEITKEKEIKKEEIKKSDETKNVENN